MILWKCVYLDWCAVAFDTRLRLRYPTALMSPALACGWRSSFTSREITQPQSGIDGRYERGEFQSLRANGF
jgi:hypothetical protein